MAMELLHELGHRYLPITVKDEVVVEQLRLLRSANFISAVMSEKGASRPFATVFCLTKRGREALRLDRQSESA
jgi:hypothetical protein